MYGKKHRLSVINYNENCLKTMCSHVFIQRCASSFRCKGWPDWLEVSCELGILNLTPYCRRKKRIAFFFLFYLLSASRIVADSSWNNDADSESIGQSRYAGFTWPAGPVRVLDTYVQRLQVAMRYIVQKSSFRGGSSPKALLRCCRIFAYRVKDVPFHCRHEASDFADASGL